MNVYTGMAPMSAILDAILSSRGDQPRGWWDRPAAGKCRGMERQRNVGYRAQPTTAKTVDGDVSLMRLPSGALYLPTQHKGWRRINHPQTTRALGIRDMARAK